MVISSKRSSLLHIGYLFLFLSVWGCSSDTSEKKIWRAEYIYRKHSHAMAIPPSKVQKRKPYPWESKFLGKYPPITKEFFRCKGNPFHQVVVKKREGKEPIYFRDCGGCEHHGLPLRNGEEFIYPCLIELLNYVQEKTGKKVIVTSAHRCPEHNTYCDQTPSNFGSKHMLGAEVDFYVEGMEHQGEKIIPLLQEYYKEHPLFKGNLEFEKFVRYDKENLNVTTKPWYNKEIFIKYYLAAEGRDFDNSHPYPYIALQVRYDRERKEKVVFDAAQTKNYLRY